MPSPLSREAVVESHRQAASLLAIGAGLWLLATLVFRLLGPFLLPTDDPGRVGFVFLLTVPVMMMLAFVVYSLLDVEPERRLTAAVLLVLPGMVLDAVAVAAFDSVFPTLTSDAGSLFGGLLLLASAAVLFTGVVPLSYVRRDDAGAGAESDADTHSDSTLDDQPPTPTPAPAPAPGHASDPPQSDPTRDPVSED